MSFTVVCFCAIVVVASLLGGWLPTTLQMTHLRMQLVLSLVAGVMLGVATIHLVPQALSYLQRIETTMAVMLVGILLMFFLNRMFHFHQHDMMSSDHNHAHEEHTCSHFQGQGGSPRVAAHPEPLASQPQLPVVSNAAVAAAGGGEREELHAGDVSAFGLLFGMAVHSVLDGIALGAAVAAEPHDHWSATGFSVFLAIALHKPLDAMSITSLMAARGWQNSWINAVNLAFALITPLGAIAFVFGSSQLGNLGWAAGLALALSAGVFLCISLGDLLPELHFHRHDRAQLSVALLLGILIAVAIEMIPGHSHGPTAKSPAAGSGPDSSPSGSLE